MTNQPESPATGGEVEEIIAALRAHSFQQDSQWHHPKANYATKPRDLLDAAADALAALSRNEGAAEGDKRYHGLIREASARLRAAEGVSEPRRWLAGQLLGEHLNDYTAYRIVAFHPAIKDATATEGPSSARPQHGVEEGRILVPSEALIKHMVNRFLGWRLPDNFSPDAGISFTKLDNPGTPYEYSHQPSGTNLLDATQAEAMVRHMLDGPASRPAVEEKLVEVPLGRAEQLASLMARGQCTTPAAVGRELQRNLADIRAALKAHGEG